MTIDHASGNFPISRAKGTYVLLLSFHRRRLIKTPKKFGSFFIAGLAVYAGRAMGPGGLQARLHWHASVEMKRDRYRRGVELHWHIDYLTIHADRIRAICRPGRYDECDLAKALLGLPGARPFPGFGCTGCEGRCESHLALLSSKMAAAVRSLAARSSF